MHAHVYAHTHIQHVRTYVSACMIISIPKHTDACASGDLFTYTHIMQFFTCVEASVTIEKYI